MFTSSRGIRRLLNRLIYFLNRYLPVSERIEFVPTIPFETENELEIVVLQYWQAIYDGYAEWHDGQGQDDPAYKTSRVRIAELEARYGARLDKYLKPYENFDAVLMPPMEGHRERVARQRAYDKQVGRH
jgi:hypothetical protein